MEVISHVCDMCKQTKTKDEMVTLELSQSYGSKVRIIGNRQRIDICPECMKKKGIVIEKTEEQTQEEVYQKNERTIREKFIEILADLDVSFYE